MKERNHHIQIQILYEALHDKMLKVAYRMIGNIETAEDLVQSTFLLALFHQQDLLNHPLPEGWLMKALQNLALNERRRINRHQSIWAASFAPPTGEKTGDFPPVFIQFCVPPAGHKKTPQVCVTHGVAPADGRSVFSYMVTGRRPRLTGTVPVSWHFVVFQRVKAHSTVVKS